MYRVKVERDSICPNGHRLTSFIIEFPRIVLAETVTHRVNSDTWGDFDASWCERTTTLDISKNSASSRAIPFPRMLEKIQRDPYMPAWTLNQKGMQGASADAEVCTQADIIWRIARDNAIHSAERLHQLGIHKQDCNRLLEPWAWVTQIVTSSRWDNFFALRCHAAAHPAFQRVARMMYLARQKSTPKTLTFGEWHLPFVPPEEQDAFRWTPDGKRPLLPDLIKFSAARCAWISYENHEKDGTPEQMLRTFDRLTAEVPVHASPCEHQATPFFPEWRSAGLPRSNLTGWLQARKLMLREEVTHYAPDKEEVAGWGDLGPLWQEVAS